MPGITRFVANKYAVTQKEPEDAIAAVLISNAQSDKPPQQAPL
jgi:hypothetical protein